MIATIRRESDLFGPIETELSLCEARLKEWRPDYAPATPKEEWLFTQIVVHSLRIDRCRQHESALRGREVKRAAICWNEDRRIEAERLFEQLHKKPALTLSKLRMTLQGCLLLIERWKSLEMSLEHGVVWSDAQRTLAIDLLGTHPVFRSAKKFDLPPKEVVAREVEALETHIAEIVNVLDAMDRDLALKGCSEPSADLKAVMRYEAQCVRRLDWARKEFFNGRKGKPPVMKSPVVSAPEFQVESEYEPMSKEEYNDHDDELFRRLIAMESLRPEPLAPVKSETSPEKNHLSTPERRDSGKL